MQTSGSTAKGGSPVTINEYTPNGATGITVALLSTGATPIQMAAGSGGSEGFLARSTDGTFLTLAGYSTSTAGIVDITVSTAASTPRVIFKVDAFGAYSQVGSSTTSYNANDIRGAVSDGTNYWASGASNAGLDGINYYGPGTPVALATSAKAYSLQLFNGQIYFSTQKVVGGVTPTFGIYALGTGMPTTGPITPTSVINTGAATPEDFSFNAAGTVCYIAINLNSPVGGIQKWTYNGSVWSLAYTLGTGATNIGAYGLAVDYSGVNPVIYATTNEANTTGNRVIKITDAGAGSSATTIVASTANTFLHGIAFAPSCPIAAQPAAFTTSTAIVDQGQNGVAYSVLNDASVTSYNWSYSGTGATINGSGNSISINFSATATGGNLSVTGSTVCGTSIARTMAISISGSMRITEYMYNGGGVAGVGEFIEFTNVGGTAIDMTGWSFDDNTRLPGSQSLTAFGTVQPGESVILTEISAATFRTNWSLCAGKKIIGGNTNNLGRADEINLYNASSTLVDRLTYDDVTLGGPRTTTKSGWVSATGLGANVITQWTLSSTADAEASYASTLAEIGSPGKSTRATVTFDPCFVANGAPTIIMDISTSDFLDGGVAIGPFSPTGISGVISDPTDPASTSGINFTINDVETPVGSLTVTATSSNTSIVPNANISLTGSGATRNLKITPVAVGYSNITVTVNDGTNNTSFVINYAASEASTTPVNTTWHTGMSDASDGIALDDNYYISGDDELNVLNVYSRSFSGLPVVSYDYTSQLALPDPTKPEVDLEAATKSAANPAKMYWLGSMSNGKAPFDDKPNRNRIFATTVSGTGATTSFSFSGYYGNLRANLITWGDANGYNFTASAAAGVDSKLINGFAAEGMVFGPDNTTLYIGMRAPLVPTATRTKAVIAPISNFETWFNNGAPSGNPTFATPIELDLGGRGFRDLIRLSNGTYIIVAGNPMGSPITSALYKWNGHASDTPILITTSADGILNMEGAIQINVSGNLSLTQIQVISDGGGDILYNDGAEAKDFADLELRKFRSDKLSSIILCMPTKGDTTAIACNSFKWYGTNYTTSSNPTHLLTNTSGCDSVVTLHLTINNSTTSSTSQTACNSYTWNGTTYASSGTYTKLLTNATGCDSTATLLLTINNSNTSSTSQTACNSYTWNGTTYASSGTYTKLLTNAAGCDSTATLLLTINNSNTSSTSQTACNSYTWNGTTYASSGTYIKHLTNSTGCDSAATLILTINSSPSITSQPTDQTPCAGGTITLSTSANGTGITYQWKKGSNNVAGANSTSLSISGASASDAGSYTCVISGSCTPPITSNAASVTVNPAPTVNAGPDQLVCSTITTVILAGSVTNTTGQTWSTSGTGTFSPSATTLSPTYLPSASDKTTGAVTLTISSANTGVCSTPFTDPVLISFHSCTEVLDMTEILDIQLIPNPNVGNILIKFSEKYQVTSLAIFNFNGEKVREISFTSGTSELNLDLHDLRSGIYTVVLKDTQGKQLVKRMIRN